MPFARRCYLYSGSDGVAVTAHQIRSILEKGPDHLDMTSALDAHCLFFPPPVTSEWTPVLI
jgi:hypothetical protein